MTANVHEKSVQLIGQGLHPIIGQVWQLAEPLCLGEGMELVHVVYQRETGGRILRVFLDKRGGVTLDDCVNISRQLSDILDVGLDIGEAYRMEVSSPGQKRPLGKVSDFHRFEGCRVKVRTARLIQEQKSFTGIIEGVSDLSVRLTIDNKPVAIMFADIVNAHLIQYNGEPACS